MKPKIKFKQSMQLVALAILTLTISSSAFAQFIPQPLDTAEPSVYPTPNYTIVPTITPVVLPSIEPPLVPSLEPPIYPSIEPPLVPSLEPPIFPTIEPPLVPSLEPPVVPTYMPTVAPLGCQRGQAGESGDGTAARPYTKIEYFGNDFRVTFQRRMRIIPFDSFTVTWSYKEETCINNSWKETHHWSGIEDHTYTKVGNLPEESGRITKLLKLEYQERYLNLETNQVETLDPYIEQHENTYSKTIDGNRIIVTWTDYTTVNGKKGGTGKTEETIGGNCTAKVTIYDNGQPLAQGEPGPCGGGNPDLQPDVAN